MRVCVAIVAGAVLVSGCGSPQQGQGFEPFEVPQTGPAGPMRTEIVMEGLPPLPRHLVSAAPTASTAASVRPYRTEPEASVAATSSEGTWLRVVDDGSRVWLVAETSDGSAPDPAALRTEAVRRSGCLAEASPVIVGQAVVFPLNCA